MLRRDQIEVKRRARAEFADMVDGREDLRGAHQKAQSEIIPTQATRPIIFESGARHTSRVERVEAEQKAVWMTVVGSATRNGCREERAGGESRVG